MDRGQSIPSPPSVVTSPSKLGQGLTSGLLGRSRRGVLVAFVLIGWPRGPPTEADATSSNRFWPLLSRTLRRGAVHDASRVMRHFRGVAHLQGLSPLESSLPPGGGLDRPGTRCSPGFSISSGLSPLLPWADASTGPPLTGFAAVQRPRRDPRPLDPLRERVRAASQSFNEQERWPISRETDIPS
jgi:hypothetical protein